MQSDDEEGPFRRRGGPGQVSGTTLSALGLAVGAIVLTIVAIPIAFFGLMFALCGA